MGHLDGGSEAAWPSTAGDFVFFPASITSAVTVTIPTGVNAAFGVLQILTNSTVTIQRAGTGQIILNTLSEADDGDINIQGTGDHVIAAPVRMDKHVLVHVANSASTLAFSGGIGQTGVRNFTKTGQGSVRFVSAVNNTYTGTTTAQSGILELLHSGGTTAIAGALIVGDNVGGATSARVRLIAANQIANASIVEIASDGLLDMNGHGDTFNLLDVIGGTVLVGPSSELTTGAITLIGGTINIGASAALRLNGNIQASSAAVQSAIIGGTGTLHLNGGSRSFIVADGPQPIDLRIDANIAATAAENVAKSGPGVALFTGTGTYTGQTVIGDGTLVVTGTLNPTGFVLPSAPTAILGGTGNVGSVAIGAGRLAPGLSPGIITTHGLGIGAGFPLAIELNGTTAGVGYD